MTDDPPMLRVLGEPRVTAGGETSALRSDTQRLIVSCLVAHHGQWLRVPLLRRALWPAGPPPSASSSLRNHVARLRNALSVLGDTSIHSATIEGIGAYRITAAEHEIDVLAFERHARTALSAQSPGEADSGALFEALALWRGTPYEGVANSLVIGHRHELQNNYLNLAEVDGARLIDQDRPGEALRRYLALARSMPQREHLCELMMRALIDVDRRSEALNLFEHCRRWLDDNLGLTPSVPTATMAAELRRSDGYRN